MEKRTEKNKQLYIEVDNKIKSMSQNNNDVVTENIKNLQEVAPEFFGGEVKEKKQEKNNKKVIAGLVVAGIILIIILLVVVIVYANK